MRLRSLVFLMAAKPILSRKDMAQRLGVSLRTVDRLKAARVLPQPVYLHGPHWRPDDIEAWEDRLRRQRA